MNSMFEIFKRVFTCGVDLQFGKLTLVDLKHYNCNRRIQPGSRRYQIHCDDKRVLVKTKSAGLQPFSQLYYETQLDEAIHKFLEIMLKIKPEVR